MKHPKRGLLACALAIVFALCITPAVNAAGPKCVTWPCNTQILSSVLPPSGQAPAVAGIVDGPLEKGNAEAVLAAATLDFSHERLGPEMFDGNYRWSSSTLTALLTPADPAYPNGWFVTVQWYRVTNLNEGDYCRFDGFVFGTNTSTAGGGSLAGCWHYRWTSQNGYVITPLTSEDPESPYSSNLFGPDEYFNARFSNVDFLGADPYNGLVGPR